MEIIKKITLERLTESSVSILTKEYILVEGTLTQLGGNKRVCLNNIPHDRERLATVVPPEYMNAVLAVWGDTPLNSDPEH